MANIVGTELRVNGRPFDVIGVAPLGFKGLYSLANQQMWIPVELFPVLFAIPRTVGWLAQWQELLEDPEQRIARPRQIYTGEGARDFVPLDER